MKTVLSFGETLWDLLPAPVLGGAPCNFAYRVNSLGAYGILATRLGRDDLGKAAFDRIAALRMDTRFIQWDDGHPTGTVPVTLDEKGIPDFVIVKDVAYDYIEAPEELLDLARRADCISFGTLVQRSPESRRTLHRLLMAGGASLRFLDLNLRRECFSRETVETSIEAAHILKLNDGELLELARMFDLFRGSVQEAAREARRRWNLKCCVVTLGEHGAFAVTEDEEVEVPGWKVEVADTIGSGDAFSAAFVISWLQGRLLTDCCSYGNALGALVARTAGATTPVTLDELNRFCGRSI